MRAAGYHDKVNYKAMSDGELKKAYDEATEKVESIEERLLVDRNEFENLPESDYPFNSQELDVEYDRAMKALNSIGDEMDDRGIVNRDMMIYQEDIDEYMGNYT